MRGEGGTLPDKVGHQNKHQTRGIPDGELDTRLREYKIGRRNIRLGGGISDWEEEYKIGRRNIRLRGGISDWEEEYKIGRRNIRLGGGI